MQYGIGKSGKRSRGSVVHVSNSLSSLLQRKHHCQIISADCIVYQGGLNVPLPSKSWVCVRSAIPVAHAQLLCTPMSVSTMSYRVYPAQPRPSNICHGGQSRAVRWWAHFRLCSLRLLAGKTVLLESDVIRSYKTKRIPLDIPGFQLFLSILDLPQIVLRTSCASANHG